MADEIDLITCIDLLQDCNGRNRREFQERTNPYDDYDEKKFRQRFRLSKNTVSKLLEQVYKTLHA